MGNLPRQSASNHTPRCRNSSCKESLLSLLPGRHDWPWVEDTLLSCQLLDIHVAVQQDPSLGHTHDECVFFPCGPRQEKNIEEDDITAFNKFGETMFVAGQRKDWVHHGVELGAVASFRIQLQGGRILVMAKLDEVQSFLTRRCQTLNLTIQRVVALLFPCLPDQVCLPTVLQTHVICCPWPHGPWLSLWGDRGGGAF